MMVKIKPAYRLGFVMSDAVAALRTDSVTEGQAL